MVPGNFIGILNKWGAAKSYLDVYHKDLAKFYRKRKALPKASEISLKPSVHCECCLGLALVKECLRSEMPSIIEIGISKPSCWICNQFLRSFNGLYPHITIHVSSSHGKLDPAWRFPHATPSEVVRNVNKQVEDALVELIAVTTHPTRCSYKALRQRYEKEFTDEWEQGFDSVVIV